MSKETLDEKILNLRTAVVSSVLRKNKIKHSTNVLGKIIINKDNFSAYNYFASRKNIKRKIIIFFILVAVLISGFLIFTFQARADSLRIIDGDTIVLNGEKIRFLGIDTPESYYRGKKQFCYLNEEKIDCANLSKLQLKEKIGANPISCEREKNKDRYGRTVAECFVNGESLSKFMVRSGYAFDWPRYSKKKYAEDEEYAKTNKLGLWTMEFEYPWIWKKNK
jgi:endonuclease YncB( thermonuclease family)